MAGIGFELRKIQQKNSFLSDLTAYTYGAMVSSGPWLMSVLCLAVLSITGTGLLEKTEREIFRTTVVYAYATSLIFIGIFQLVTTRHLADTLYANNIEQIIKTYITVLCMVLCAGLPSGALAVIFLDLSTAYKGAALTLFMVVCALWIQMIFLSALKDYKTIFHSFVLGTGASILAAWFLEKIWGLEGFLLGYTLGQATLLFLLLSKILTELPEGRGLWDHALLKAFSTYKDLAVIGVVYNLGIWIDKILFWNAPDSRLITPLLRTHDLYDAPVFLAYLTIVPAMSIFMVKAETTFYEHYRAYYAKVIGRQNLRTIVAEKRKIIQILNVGARELLLIQGGISLVCIIFAPQIAATAGLSPIQVPLFRASLVGAFLQALLSMLVIILFYFEFRTRVLVVTLVFLISNWGLSWTSIQMGLPYYGYGYCYSCLLALLVGIRLLSTGIRDLEYLTFAKQPVS